MDTSDFVQELREEMKSLDDELEQDDYENAIGDALADTGWALPQTSAFEVYWIKQRSKRHIYNYMLADAAEDFKFEGINLQHRFDHYKYLVSQFDKEWTEIQESRPEKFAGVDSFKMFGTKVDAGFAYADDGQDLTYDDDFEVTFTPTEND